MSPSATTKETDGSGALTESGSDQTPAQSTPGQKTAVFGVHTSSGRVPDQVVTYTFSAQSHLVLGHFHGVMISLALFHILWGAKGGSLWCLVFTFVLAGVQDHSEPRHPRATLHARRPRPGGGQRRPLAEGPVLGACRSRERRGCRRQRGTEKFENFGFLGVGFAVLVLLFVVDGGGGGGWTREAFQDSVRLVLESVLAEQVEAQQF